MASFTAISVDLSRFIGGEAEIQNSVEDYLYRGEIASIKIERNTLVIEFAWFAKNRGGPLGGEKGFSMEWDNESNLHYAAGLDIYSPSNLSDGRLAFESWMTGELLVLFPVDGSKMNPEGIHGLPEDIKQRQRAKWQQWQASR